MLASNKILSAILIFILISAIMDQNCKHKCNGQIFRRTENGFDIDVGPFFKMNYDRSKGKTIDLNAMSGLVKFDYDKNPKGGRQKVGVDVFGIGNRPKDSPGSNNNKDEDYVFDDPQ